MDPGRYGVQQGWDNNSALEGYGAAHDPNFRVGSSYDDRRFIDDRYSGESIYQRNAYPRDVLERENYAPPPSTANFWPNSRKRSHEEEYPLERGSRRHDKPYSDNYNDIDTYRDREVATFEGHDKHRDGYRGVDNYRDHGYDRPTRGGGRNRDDYSYDDHGHGNRNPHQHREGSRERDHGYGRHSFDSDYDRSGRREGPLRRRGYRDREHDKITSSRERDHSPHGRYRPSHSRSRSRSHSPSRSRSYGRDDHLRSRSPHGRSRSRSYREDSYDDGWHERSDRQRDRDEHHREAYAAAPSATVVVKGLSQKTTEEDLYQILAEWGPLRHVRVIKERMSGLSRGFAFIDFPSVGAAKAMMDRIGEDGLVVDGRKIFFEYSSKPTGSGGAFTQENSVRSGHGNHKSMTVPSDWMCIICGCVNFARRTSCFQVVSVI